MRWIYDSSRIICGILWNSCSMKLEHLLRLGALCGEKWEMIRLQPGRAKLSCIWKTTTSRIWIESMVWERSSSGKYSQESQRWPSSRRFKVWWETYSVILSSSTTGSSSCQCTATLHGEKKETQKGCEYNPKTFVNYALRFPRGRWSFLECGSEKKWCGTCTDKPDGSWDRMAEDMMMNFTDSCHPIFRASSAFDRMVLRNGHSTIGYFSGKRRRSQEKISTLRESKLFQSIPVPSSNSRTSRRQCHWSWVARQCTVSRRIYWVHLPRWEREWIEFHNKKWISSRRKKPQKRKSSGILHHSEPDGRRIWYGRNSMRSDETKDRAPQEHLETPSKYCVLVQFEARSRERLAIFLTSAVACSRSLQHTTCSLHWESGMYEDTGWALPKGSLTPTVPRVVLKSSSQYGQQDPQSQDARSSWEPSNDSKSFRETWNNTVDYRISGAPLSVVEQQATTRENTVKKLIDK